MKVTYWTRNGRTVHTASEDGTILCSIHDPSVKKDVLCPHCGQPTPDWERVTTRMMRENSGKYIPCSLCERVRITAEQAFASLTGGDN